MRRCEITFFNYILQLSRHSSTQKSTSLSQWIRWRPLPSEHFTRQHKVVKKNNQEAVNDRITTKRKKNKILKTVTRIWMCHRKAFQLSIFRLVGTFTWVWVARVHLYFYVIHFSFHSLCPLKIKLHRPTCISSAHKEIQSKKVVVARCHSVM